MNHNFLQNTTVKTLFRALVILLFFSTDSLAQAPGDNTIADKVIAVIGRNKIVLHSELQAQLASIKAQSPEQYHDSVKCQILQQMITSKMLVEQAERDSVVVADEDVEAALDNRIRYFIARVYGTRERMEQATGKTIYQIKSDYKNIIKEQMVAERVQGKLLQNVSVTPTEVKSFYEKIPQDSLPYFPATIELGQIVIAPPVSEEMDSYARTRIENIRKEIVTDGKDFEMMAGLYSQDPGSRDEGGRYNNVARTGGGWAKEFVVAAFKLQPGEVSPPVKTQFGYHIIQMIQRKGDVADVRHILIKAERTSFDYKKAMLKLDSVRSELISGKISFAQAVGKYSNDEQSKLTGGMITDAQTGSSSLEIDQLDPALVMTVDSMTVGAYSQPQMFTDARGDKMCRIIYMKGRTEPHKANLVDDYNKIQQVALQQKQAQKLEQWVKDKLPSFYIKIDNSFNDCPTLWEWTKNKK